VSRRQRPLSPSSFAPVDDVLADLDQIERSLDAILEPLDDAGWQRPTPAEGWTVGDTVSHLAWFEEQAELAARDPEKFASNVNELLSGGIDGYMAVAIDLGRGKPGSELLDWWRRARGAAQDAFRGLDPAGRVSWFGPSMASRTFVGARVMETFAHGTDVADALEVPFPTGGALRHVAALGVKTFGWSFQNRGLAVPDHRVRVELTDPDGEVHRWNEHDTQSVVGTLEDFSLVVTQRRHVDDTGLTVDGPTARQWMEIAQCFAGPPGPGRQPAKA
jgi:uncharacterized protein (TIGR03084 family)